VFERKDRSFRCGWLMRGICYVLFDGNGMRVSIRFVPSFHSPAAFFVFFLNHPKKVEMKDEHLISSSSSSFSYNHQIKCPTVGLFGSVGSVVVPVQPFIPSVIQYYMTGYFCIKNYFLRLKTY
jgi:hypothetical protein